jgi:hypothetical protein
MVVEVMAEAIVAEVKGGAARVAAAGMATAVS